MVIVILVQCKYAQILCQNYCFQVRDLLGKDQSTRLEVKERPDVGVYVKVSRVVMSSMYRDEIQPIYDIIVELNI